MSIDNIKLWLDLDYLNRKFEYDVKVSELSQKRKRFYEDNPNFPNQFMFMNVIAPPQKIEIKIIN